MNEICLTSEPVPLIIARSLLLSQPLLEMLNIESTRRTGALGDRGLAFSLVTLLLE